jgi:OOP family OmpA-OmpF porin
MEEDSYMKNQHTPSAKYTIPISAILFASSVFIPILSHAKDEQSLGYQYDAQGNVLRDAQGNCLRSSQWSPSNAIAACDPGIVKQRAEEVPVREKKAKLVSSAGVTEVNAQVDIVVLQAGEDFAFNNSDLSAKGQQQIATLVGRHTDDYVHRVYVDGYTDEIGDKEYNMGLSQRRADAVKAQLVADGIPPERIVTAAHGSEYPIVSCPDMTGEALIECLAPNRRTEIKFVIPVISTAVNAEFVARRRQEEIKDKNIKEEAVVVNSSIIDEGFNKAVKIIGDGCSHEVATLCGDIPLGQGKILACLESNDSKLSSTCKASIAQGKSTIESALGNANYFGASCGPDMARLCADVTPGEGRVVACLKENQSNLEKRCYDAMYALDLLI